MFLKIICLNVAVVCIFAAPPTDVVPLEKQQPTVIPIVAQSEELEANGTFKYSYETANGIKREETSYDKVLPRAKSASSNEGEEESNEIHVQQGSYSYTAPDGTLISVRYIADENGFRPIGDHLPKPPSPVIAVSPARIAGRKPKTADNTEVGSAPAAVIASAPASKENLSEALTASEISNASESPNVESKIAALSAEQATTPVLEGSQESSTTEVVPTTEVATTEPATSTTESSSTTTEQALSPEITSTEQPTTEAASTPEPSSEPSTIEEVASNPTDSPSDSTPAISTPDVTSAESTPDATTPESTSAASMPDATTSESSSVASDATTPESTSVAFTPDATPAESTSDVTTPEVTQVTSTSNATTPDATPVVSKPGETPSNTGTSDTTQAAATAN